MSAWASGVLRLLIFLRLTAGANGFGELLEYVFGGGPADTLVGDRLSVVHVCQIALQLLGSLDQVAFDHH